MQLPKSLAYLRDVAIAEAKRHGHEDVEPRHLASAILRADSEVLVARFGESAANAIEESLTPPGKAFATPEPTSDTIELLEEASSRREPVDALVASLGLSLGLERIDSLPDAEDTESADVPTEDDVESVATAGPEIDTNDGESSERIEDLLANLDSLIGIPQAKSQIAEMIQRKRIAAERRKHGLPELDEASHLVFVGNPGTGKTTVARLISRIYAALGIVSKGSLVEATRADLVGGYVGHTALKTRQIVESALGGILFIDEAYALSRYEGTNDFGIESLDTLVSMMEEYRHDLAIIVAGYPAEMQTFLDSNPGLRSRFSRIIPFGDFEVTELMQIFELFCADNQLQASGELQGRIEQHLKAVPNVFQHILGQQALRLARSEELSVDELRTLEEDDFALEDPDPEYHGGMYL